MIYTQGLCLVTGRDCRASEYIVEWEMSKPHFDYYNNQCRSAVQKESLVILDDGETANVHRACNKKKKKAHHN